MTRPLRIASPETVHGVSREGDRVASWLGVMVGMIGAPDSERRGVRDELESHLRERVRDLMLSGLSETDATGRAIAELGDAAALAKRYQEAIKPSKRRLFMQVAAMSFAGAAAVLSVVALTGANQPTPGLGGGGPGTASGSAAGVGTPSSVDAVVELRVAELLRAAAGDRYLADHDARVAQLAMQDAEHQRAVQAQTRLLDAVVEQQRATLAAIEAREAALGLRGNTFVPQTDDAMELLQSIEVTLTPQTTWDQFFKAIVPKGGALQVRREQFDSAGVSLDSSVNLGSFTGSAAEALTAINATVCKSPEQEIGVRASGQNLIVAPAAHFDVLEQTLATYDLSPLIRQRAERTGGNPEPGEIAEEVSKLITSLVFPEQWMENGGDRASVRSFESKMFIQAPRRFHPKVAWILGELGARQEGNAMGGAGATLEMVPVLRSPGPAAGIQIQGTSDGRVRATGGAGGEVVTDQLNITTPGGMPGGMTGAGAAGGSGSGSAGTRGGGLGGTRGGSGGGAPAPERGAMTHINSKQASYTLHRVKAEEMRDLLGTVLNIVPRLKECPVPRTLGIAPGDGNVLEIGATTAQVHDIWTILAALDADVPADAARRPETKQFPLQHIDAVETRELLGRWFNANATLKECPVTRMVAADTRTNSVIVTATSPQVAAMGELIAAMDAPK